MPLKDVVDVRFNLKIAGQKRIIIFCSTIIKEEAAETGSYHQLFSEEVK